GAGGRDTGCWRVAPKAAELEGGRPFRVVGGGGEGTNLRLGGGARAVPAGDAPPPAAYHGRGRPGRGGAHRRPHGRLHAGGDALRHASTSRLQAPDRAGDTPGLEAGAVTATCSSISPATRHSESPRRRTPGETPARPGGRH